MAEVLLETPLFPLSLVLVPGMALPLHIFEPRYRRMTCDCLDSNQQVGVVLALPGVAEASARVGTLARIIDYERLPDGRYNLLALGTKRFEIIELRHDHPYLSGLVRLLPEQCDGCGTSTLSDLAREARLALGTYLRHVLTLVGGEDGKIAIPEDPIELSYVIVMCLARADAEKQRLLEMSSVARRLRAGTRLLRAESQELALQAERSPLPPSDQNRAALN